MATNNEFKAQNPNKNLHISIAFFVGILALTVALFFYSSYLGAKEEKIQTQISEVSTQISNLKLDKKIELYTLLTSNDAFLAKYKKLSEIPTYINNVKELSRGYGVSLVGFDYNSGTIGTKFTADNDAVSYAFVKTKNFLEYFRKKDENIFSLDFVSTLE